MKRKSLCFLLLLLAVLFSVALPCFATDGEVLDENETLDTAVSAEMDQTSNVSSEETEALVQEETTESTMQTEETLKTEQTTVTEVTTEAVQTTATEITTPIETTTKNSMQDTTENTMIGDFGTSETSLPPKKNNSVFLWVIVGCVFVISAAVVVGCFCFIKKKNKSALQDAFVNCKKISVCVQGGTMTGKSFIVLDHACIGRDSARCEIVLPMDSGADAVHCELAYAQGNVFLKDLGSCSGTYLEDGTKLESERSYPLVSGSRFSVGKNRYVFIIAF